MKAKTYKGKSMRLGGGGQFAKLKDAVAMEYEKKGMSKKKAEAIGAAVAAKQGIKRLGQKKMTKIAVAGKKRDNKMK